MFVYIEFAFLICCSWKQGNEWSLSRISEYGYVRGHATREELKMEVGIVYLLVRHHYSLSHYTPCDGFS